MLLSYDTEDVSLNRDRLSSVDDSVDATASTVSLFFCVTAHIVVSSSGFPAVIDSSGESSVVDVAFNVNKVDGVGVGVVNSV